MIIVKTETSIHPSTQYIYSSATSINIILCLPTWILLQHRPQISEANIPGVGHVKLQEFLPEVSQLVGEQCVSHHIHAYLNEVAPLHELVQSSDDV